MNCEKIREEIGELAEAGKTELQDRPEISGHIKECPGCSGYHSFILKLSSLKPETCSPSSDFTRKTMDKILYGRYERVNSAYLGFRKAAFSFAVIIFLAIAGFLKFGPFSGRSNQVVFLLEYPGARTVSVAGNFNDWEKDITFLRRENGKWKLKLQLEPGVYEYVYIIDGRKLIADPFRETVPDGFGGNNSVLKI